MAVLPANTHAIAATRATKRCADIIPPDLVESMNLLIRSRLRQPKDAAATAHRSISDAALGGDNTCIDR
jgi:hypothetical protein